MKTMTPMRATTLPLALGLALAGAGACGEPPSQEETTEESLTTSAIETTGLETEVSLQETEADADSESVAAASWGACYAVGAYSFKHKYDGAKRTIYAYNGASCGGGSISYGRAKRFTVSDGSEYILITARDTECDNKGITTYTNHYSASAPRCNQSGHNNKPARAFGTHFWIRVAGTVNSRAVSLP